MAALGQHPARFATGAAACQLRAHPRSRALDRGRGILRQSRRVLLALRLWTRIAGVPKTAMMAPRPAGVPTANPAAIQSTPGRGAGTPRRDGAGAPRGRW